MEIKIIGLDIPEGANIIFGQSHFIKTVEDLYEIMVGAVPGVKFGMAFCEASGDRLIRHDGNDDALIESAKKNAESVGAGHSFIVVLKEAFPHQLFKRHQGVPRGVPNLLRHRQPRPGHRGRDRPKPWRVGCGGRSLPKRDGRPQRRGLAQRVSPDHRLQEMSPLLSACRPG